MVKTLVLVFTFAAGAAFSAVGETWYVDSAVSPGEPDGRCWETAFPSIQEGIDAAASGDRVRVACGAYEESVVLSKRLVLEGGCAAPMGGERGLTVLSGGAASGSGHLVPIVLIEGTDGVTLRGFSIRGGRVDGETDGGSGGGLLVRGATGVSIEGCTFYGNSARYGGGVAWLDDSAGSMSRCLLSGNKAFQGGGVHVANSRLTLDRTVISGCSAVHGGAIFLDGAAVDLVNCVLTGNSALVHAGGIWTESGELTLNCCTVRANRVGALETGAIHAVAGVVALVNSVLEGNTGFGVYAPSHLRSFSLDHCVVAGNGRAPVNPPLAAAANQATALVSVTAAPSTWFAAVPAGNWTGYAEYDPATTTTSFPVSQLEAASRPLPGQLIDVNTDYQMHAVVLEVTEAGIVVAGDFAEYGIPGASYAMVDYHVSAASPLVGKAGDRWVPSDDIDGEPRNANAQAGPHTDIGADAFVDSDGDGIPDYWEKARGLDPAIRDADGDPDGDGLTSAREYQLEFGPNQPSGTQDPGVETRPGFAPLQEFRAQAPSFVPTSPSRPVSLDAADLYVRFGVEGVGDGSQGAPYSSLAQAAEPLDAGGTVHLLGADGATAETPLLSKSMRLQAEEGPVRIGDPAAAVPFEEENPTWGRPELALTSLEIDPDRTGPGESVLIQATVENLGTGPAEGAVVRFYVAGSLVGERAVDLLDVGGLDAVRTSYTADLPGAFAVSAELHYPENGKDRDVGNNARGGRLWVSGEDSPDPALQLGLALNPESADLHAGSSAALDLQVRNPSFADMDDIPAQFYVDGVLVHEGYVGPLAAGDEAQVTFPWSEISEGTHQLSVELDLPEGFPNFEHQRIWSWDCTIPGPTGAYAAPGPHQWASIGPSLITNGYGGCPYGSVGRIDTIVPHPTNPNILYAGAPTGGIWRTANGGASWEPIGDALPLLNIGAMAMDPEDTDIIYAVSGTANYGGGLGIFKSVDAGNSWTEFARAVEVGGTDISIRGANDIIIRYPSPGNVLIYVGSNQGVLRYTSSTPDAPYSSSREWTHILPGKVGDLAVDPGNNSILYASLISTGLYKTTSGETATQASDWTQLTNGLPAINTIHPKLPGGEARTGQAWQVGIFRTTPSTVYAALPNPLGSYENQPRLTVYRSTDSGASWETFLSSNEGGLYSPFLAVHPTIDGLIYFSGVKLYRYLEDESFLSSILGAILIHGVHDDMHTFVWDPTDAAGLRYFVGCDGGIWRGTISLPGGDLVLHRNTNLRTTMFFDFDASQTDPDMMLGGTQDNGTILYQGNDAWKLVKSGDGNYSLIAPGNQKLYAQHQWMETTVRCDNGGACSHQNWVDAGNGLMNKEGGLEWYIPTAQIACSTAVDSVLAAQGVEVYYTANSGGSWAKIGPTDSSYQGHITRVAFQPVRERIAAGTSSGQVWVRYDGDTTPNWVKVFDPPVGTGAGAIESMAFSSVDHEVLYLTYDSNQPWARLYMLRIHDEPAGASKYPITGDLPVAHFLPFWPKKISGFDVNTICGDGYTTLIAYVGTDRGVYRGETYAEGGLWTWTPYNDGFPNVRVTDLVVDPTSRELRAATYGRGAWATITGP